MFPLNRKYLHLTLSAALLAALAQGANASALPNNVSGLGNNFAGEAAIADDASTEFYNPAGLAFFNHQQFVAGGIYSLVTGDFSGAQVTPPPTNFVQEGIAHTTYDAIIPLMFYSQPITDRLVAGLSITPIFAYGGTNYGEDSIVRYSGTKNILGVMDISPGFGFKVVDNFSIGAGLDITHLHSVNDTDVLVGAPNPDAKILNRASAWGYGWHAGLLWQINPCVRAGYTFHSRIKFNPKGTSSFYTNLGQPQEIAFITNDFKYQIVSPANHALTFLYDVNKAWALMTTFNYIQWTQFKAQVFENISTPPAAFGGQGLVNGGGKINYGNRWSWTVGTNYRLNETWMLRAGAGYASDYTNIRTRIAQAPNAPTYQVAVGFNYALSEQFSVDFGFEHIIARTVPINIVTATGTQLGDFKLGYDAIGMQFNWTMR